MKTVLVTGARGYIGKNLCRYLIDKGLNVVQIDKQRLGQDLCWMDFDEYRYMGIEGIVHLAALPGIKDCEENPDDAVYDNIIATSNILNLAREIEARFIFASSQAAKEPKSSVYAFTKFTDEAFIRQYDDSVILQFANVYGGIGMLEDKTTVIANFMRQYLDEKPLTIHGDGTQTRDFVHVEDICQAIYLSLTRNVEGNSYRLYEVGTGEETSVIDIAKEFEHDYIFIENRNVGVTSNHADITNIKKDLGYNPVWDVFNFIDEFKKEHNYIY